MANKTKTSAIVDEYFKKWNHLPTMTLAKKIYNENIGAFTSVDHVRTLIRTRKGTNGSYKRAATADKKHYTETAIKKLSLEDIEDGIDEREQDYIFAKSIERMLVISDIHIPYHDKGVLEKFAAETKNIVLASGLG